LLREFRVWETLVLVSGFGVETIHPNQI